MSLSTTQFARQPDAWQGAELQRHRHRFPTLQAVGSAWVLHHFRCERGAQGERLVERRGFAPLPHRGVFADHGAEYKLEFLRADQRQHFIDFLVQGFGGRVLPGGDRFSARVQVGEHLVSVHDGGFYVASGKPYLPGRPEDPQVERAFVRRLGEAFDAELASGRLDHLFGEAPATATR